LPVAKDGASFDRTRPSRSIAIFASGFAIGLVVLHVAVTRPMTQEFGRLQHQMDSLQWGVQKLTGQTEQAAKAGDLLGLLAEQGRQSQAAADALAEIRTLQAELINGQGATADAQTALNSLTKLRRQARDAQSDSRDVAAALDKLQSLQDQLIGQYHSIVGAQTTVEAIARLRELAEAEGARVMDARRALESLIELESRTLAERERAERAVTSVEQWERLNDRLVHASEHAAEARDASEDLIAIKETILCGNDDLHPQAARAALDELVRLRERLQNEATEIAAAHTGLDGLLSLKDRILARTADLAETIETLELTGDLNRQLQDAMRQFEGVRRWLVEMVMLEPTVERAVGALKPLADLANLRRLSPNELRQAARAIANDRAARFAEKLPAAETRGEGILDSDIPAKASLDEIEND
jgi:hypothetical protein